MTEPQTLAVFDFDDTLIHGDSMRSFFVLVAGWPRYMLASICTAFLFGQTYFLQHDSRTPIDRGTFFKEQMLQRLIAGRRVETFREPIALLRASLNWNDAMRRTLQEHCDKGHRVVIATGSLDLYMSELVRDLPPLGLLPTDIEVVDGVATGVMHHGNTVRQGKAERVAAYIVAHGPFGETYGYGNFPDDVPMLNLMKVRVIV